MTITVKARHRLNIWPELDESDLSSLVEDIRRNGQVMPIVVYEGQILDGWTRQRACLELGIEPRFQEVDLDTDELALELSISLNERRRHLTVAQRADLAARIATLKQGWRRRANVSREISGDGGGPTIPEAARLMGISTAAVHRMKAVRRYGDVQLVEDVTQGRTSLSAAAAQVTPQRRFIDLNVTPSEPRTTETTLTVVSTSPDDRERTLVDRRLAEHGGRREDVCDQILDRVLLGHSVLTPVDMLRAGWKRASPQEREAFLTSIGRRPTLIGGAMDG